MLLLIPVLLISLFTQAGPNSSKFVCSEETNAEIIWDEWGAPHIYADQEADLFFGMVWAQIRNHTNLITRHIVKSGIAAEYWGAEFLEV